MTQEQESAGPQPKLAGFDTPNNESILRLPQVKAQVGKSRATIYSDIKKGTFPKPILIGPRATGWLQSEIQSWIASRIAASRNK